MGSGAMDSQEEVWVQLNGKLVPIRKLCRLADDDMMNCREEYETWKIFDSPDRDFFFRKWSKLLDKAIEKFVKYYNMRHFDLSYPAPIKVKEISSDYEETLELIPPFLFEERDYSSFVEIPSFFFEETDDSLAGDNSIEPVEEEADSDLIIPSFIYEENGDSKTGGGFQSKEVVKLEDPEKLKEMFGLYNKPVGKNLYTILFDYNRRLFDRGKSTEISSIPSSKLNFPLILSCGYECELGFVHSIEFLYNNSAEILAGCNMLVNMPERVVTSLNGAIHSYLYSVDVCSLFDRGKVLGGTICLNVYSGIWVCELVLRHGYRFFLLYIYSIAFWVVKDGANGDVSKLYVHMPQRFCILGSTCTSLGTTVVFLHVWLGYELLLWFLHSIVLLSVARAEIGDEYLNKLLPVFSLVRRCVYLLSLDSHSSSNAVYTTIPVRQQDNKAIQYYSWFVFPTRQACCCLLLGVFSWPNSLCKITVEIYEESVLVLDHIQSESLHGDGKFNSTTVASIHAGSIELQFWDLFCHVLLLYEDNSKLIDEMLVLRRKEFVLLQLNQWLQSHSLKVLPTIIQCCFRISQLSLSLYSSVPSSEVYGRFRIQERAPLSVFQFQWSCLYNSAVYLCSCCTQVVVVMMFGMSKKWRFGCFPIGLCSARHASRIFIHHQFMVSCITYCWYYKSNSPSDITHYRQPWISLRCKRSWELEDHFGDPFLMVLHETSGKGDIRKLLMRVDAGDSCTSSNVSVKVIQGRNVTYSMLLPMRRGLVNNGKARKQLGKMHEDVLFWGLHLFKIGRNHQHHFRIGSFLQSLLLAPNIGGGCMMPVRILIVLHSRPSCLLTFCGAHYLLPRTSQVESSLRHTVTVGTQLEKLKSTKPTSEEHGCSAFGAEAMELKKTFLFTDALNSANTRLLATTTVSRSDSVSPLLILEDKDNFERSVRSCIPTMWLGYLRWKFKLLCIRLTVGMYLLVVKLWVVLKWEVPWDPYLVFYVKVKMKGAFSLNEYCEKILIELVFKMVVFLKWESSFYAMGLWSGGKPLLANLYCQLYWNLAIHMGCGDNGEGSSSVEKVSWTILIPAAVGYNQVKLLAAKKNKRLTPQGMDKGAADSIMRVSMEGAGSLNGPAPRPIINKASAVIRPIAFTIEMQMFTVLLELLKLTTWRTKFFILEDKDISKKGGMSCTWTMSRVPLLIILPVSSSVSKVESDVATCGIVGRWILGWWSVSYISSRVVRETL